MRNEIKNFKIETESISTELDIVSQKTLTIQKHDVEEVFLMLSNNRKDWRYETVYAPGYFNNKTNFLVGNKNSLYIIDENAKQVINEDNQIKNLIDRKDTYIIYPIPCFNLKQNDEFIIEINRQDYIIKLSNHFGKEIGKILAKQDKNIKTELYNTDKYLKFIDIFIQDYYKENINCFKLDKNIIINSNYEFILGILNGYIEYLQEKSFIINNRLNLYSFSTMLNYLGASYSIRNSKNNNKNVWIQLPSIFKGYLPDKFIKDDQFLLYRNKKTNKLIVKNGKNLLYFDNENTLEEKVGNGKYLLIPTNDFIFNPIGSSNNMYDMTCEKSNSTNFISGFSPIMKNSDGDILGVQGIFTKEALEDVKKISPGNKDYYRNLNNGEIQNWIADDAILGLYQITKDLK